MKKYLWILIGFLLATFLVTDPLPAKTTVTEIPVFQNIITRSELQDRFLSTGSLRRTGQSESALTNSFGKIMLNGQVYLLKNEALLSPVEKVNGHTLSVNNPAFLYNPLDRGISRIAHTIENRNPEVEYFLQEDGSLAMDEFVEKDGKIYYYDDHGSLVTDSILTRGNRTFYLDHDGSRVDKNTYKARQYARLVISSIGSDPRDLFNWTVNHISYQKEGTARSLQDYAVLGFENQAGNCYCFAGVFYFLMDTLGYPVRFVRGSVLFENGNGGAHGWVLIDENGKEYVYDPSAQNDLGDYEDFFRIDPMDPPVRYEYRSGTEPNGGYLSDWDLYPEQ